MWYHVVWQKFVLDETATSIFRAPRKISTAVVKKRIAYIFRYPENGGSKFIQNT